MKLHIFFSVALILAYSYESALAQENRGRGCPIINVSRPELASTGPTLTYKANIQSGDPMVTPTFKWTVSVGKITGGQGTSEVSVDSEGNNSITVTVEVIGYAANCPNKAAYSWIADRVMSRKFDEYRDIKFSEERLRLDQFAIELLKEPNSKGYIIVYDAMDRRKTVAREHAERAKNYLTKERGLQETQIVVMNGGCRDTRSVELFITPAGAMPPTATPSGSPK
jgi:hypothetical protein